MNIYLIGLYEKRTYSEILFNSLYQTIPVSSVKLESKYITTQFNSIQFDIRHYNKTPLIKLDASNSEFRGYVILNSSYQKYIKSYTFYLDSSYMKLNYSNFYFTGRYTASSQKYIKFDAKYQKNSYTVYSYSLQYLAFTFVRVGLTGKYLYGKADENLQKSLTFINSYSNIKPIYFNVGGAVTSGSFNVEANYGIKSFIYGYIDFNSTNKINIDGLLNGSYKFRAEQVADINGIESSIGNIRIHTPQDVGSFSFDLLFSAVNEPVGGFISNVMYIKIRRNIKEYKFFDKSLSIPLIFKNVKFKNYLQPFVFVDVNILEQSKIKNIFSFEKKINEQWLCEGLTVNNFIDTSFDISYHTIKTYQNPMMIYGFKSTKNGYGVAISKEFNLFVLPTAQSKYSLSNSVFNQLFIQKLHIDNNGDFNVFKDLPFITDRYTTLNVYKRTSENNIFFLEGTKVYNSIDFNKIYIAYCEKLKVNILPIKNSINVCDTFAGNKLIANLHRHLYTDSTKNILNTILTSYRSLVDNIGDSFFRLDFSMLDVNINDNMLYEISLKVTNLSEKVELLNIDETFAISLHVDFPKLNDIILLEIPFHVSPLEGSTNVGGLMLEANIFIGLEHIRDIIFILCEFKAD